MHSTASFRNSNADRPLAGDVAAAPQINALERSQKELAQAVGISEEIVGMLMQRIKRTERLYSGPAPEVPVEPAQPKREPLDSCGVGRLHELLSNQLALVHQLVSELGQFLP